MQTVEVHGKKYEVVLASDAQGMPDLRAELDRKGVARQLFVKLPNGRRHFMVFEMMDGSIDQSLTQLF